jgi:hypothetical protein
MYNKPTIDADIQQTNIQQTNIKNGSIFDSTSEPLLTSPFPESSISISTSSSK